MNHRGVVFFLATALVGLAAAQAVLAHAFLDHAIPRVGSTVSSSPPAVILTFTEPVEPEFCKVEVRDADGKVLETGALEHPEPEQLRMTLPSLPEGDYRVHWAVTSVDTHQTEGSFDFTVRAP